MTATYQVTDTASRGAASYVGPDPVELQQYEFGGVKIGAAFYGWLCANAMATLLLVASVTAVTGFGLDVAVEQQARGTPEVTALVGAATVAVVFVLAYYSGGYVAGRMARFDGRRQGFVAWLLGLLATGGLAVAGALTGVAADVLARVELPSVPLDERTVMVGGLVALVLVLVLTLLAALAGGKTGERYHRRVDRAVLSL